MSKVGEIGVRQMFQDRDFRGLTFNVMKVKGDILKAFPVLADLKSWKNYKKADANKVMRFIVLMFDPGSPLKERERVVEQRRHVAAILSGWEKRDKGYEVITKLEDKVHLEMVADYLAYVSNRDWTMIVIAETLFHRYTQMALTGNFNTVRGIPEAMEEINKKLDTYYNKMFKDGETAKYIRRGRISAEAIAKKTSVQED